MLPLTLVATLITVTGEALAFSHLYPSTALIKSPAQRLSKAREEEHLLIPETNPDLDPYATSLSGVPYSLVMSAIDTLYPPEELSNRNSRSRTDGYWKFIKQGDSPPQELTYGEFDVDFFGKLLDRAWELHGDNNLGGTKTESNHLAPWSNKTFLDIGSGAGRLVFAAAALHPEMKMCRGLEVLEGLHELSISLLGVCRSEGTKERTDPNQTLRIPLGHTNNNKRDCLRLAPVNFMLGSFTDPYEYLGDVDCAFVFSSCMKTDLLKELSLAIGRQCKPGTIIITTEFPLFLCGNVCPLEDDKTMPHGPYEIQLLEKIDGWCWLLGGESTAYIHRVKTSLSEDYASAPKRTPHMPLEEVAYRLVQSVESGTLTNTDEFLRKVRNDMIFHGIPKEFLPTIDDG